MTINLGAFDAIRNAARNPLRMLTPRFSQGQDELRDLLQPIGIEEDSMPRLLRFSLIIFSAATLLFIVWAAITPVKELARTEGQVIPAGYNRLVQHLEGGLVREILVREGDFVKKDQIIVRVDGAGAEEDLHEQGGMVTSHALHEERLKALLDNRAPNFTAISKDKDQIAEQLRMYTAAKTSREHERNALMEQVSQKRNSLARAKEALQTARATMAIAEESRATYEKLQKEGYATRSVYLKRLEEYTTRKGDVASIEQQIEIAQKELQEYQQRQAALEAQQRDASYTELHKVQTDLARQQQEWKKSSDRVGRLDVKAPVDGYVKGLKINTIGAVIPAGQTLMELVPTDDKLAVEIRILPQQIGRVVVGQEVQVKVNSYDYIRYGTIPGKLDFISAMTFTDEAKREDYYKGRVTLSHNYVGPVEGRDAILPGMTVDADIVIGEKTVLGYLMKPIRNALHNSFTEQ
jgi:HlyD family secretion protein/adhesin transport system membrane fusion protein